MDHGLLLPLADAAITPLVARFGALCMCAVFFYVGWLSCFHPARAAKTWNNNFERRLSRFRHPTGFMRSLGVLFMALASVGAVATTLGLVFQKQ